jgi:hypothetical protein
VSAGVLMVLAANLFFALTEESMREDSRASVVAFVLVVSALEILLLGGALFWWGRLHG